LSRPDENDQKHRLSQKEIRELLNDTRKRKRLAAALSRAMWEEEREQLETEDERRMKG
jgi:hypothetical protein